jgi:CRP-like cAMP-binding protein
VNCSAAGFDRTDCLAEVDIFADLTPAEMDALAAVARTRTYAAGELLYSPQNLVEALFILKKGRVRVFRATADGRAFTTGIINPGTIFGEIVLTGQRVYDSYAEALDETVVCVMRRDRVLRYLLSDPRIAARIVETLGRRLAEMERRLSDTVLKSVHQRVAATLATLAGDRVRHGAGAPSTRIALTHEQLAALVGTSPVTAGKALSELADRGLIHPARGEVIILDVASIAAEAGDLTPSGRLGPWPPPIWHVVSAAVGARAGAHTARPAWLPKARVRRRCAAWTLRSRPSCARSWSGSAAHGCAEDQLSTQARIAPLIGQLFHVRLHAAGRVATAMALWRRPTTPQRWWRTLPNDAFLDAAQQGIDDPARRMDASRRIRDGQRVSLGELAAGAVRPVPDVPCPAGLAVTRTVSPQALVALRGNSYSVPPGLSGTVVTVRPARQRGAGDRHRRTLRSRGMPRRRRVESQVGDSSSSDKSVPGRVTRPYCTPSVAGWWAPLLPDGQHLRLSGASSRPARRGRGVDVGVPGGDGWELGGTDIGDGGHPVGTDAGATRSRT